MRQQIRQRIEAARIVVRRQAAPMSPDMRRLVDERIRRDLQRAWQKKEADEAKMRRARQIRAAKNQVRDALSAWQAHKGNSKLTPELVREIRASYAAGDVTQRELAAKHGISPFAISSLVTGASWAWVGGEIQEPRDYVRLTAMDVRSILARCAGGRPTSAVVTELAERYGVSREAIWAVVSRRRWQWVESKPKGEAGPE